MNPWLVKCGPVLLVYVVAMSGVAFALMGVDKRRAGRGAWRISERTLFLTAALGGSPGAILGMWVFHHKTRHWYFRIGLPVLLAAQVALVVWVLLLLRQQA